MLYPVPQRQDPPLLYHLGHDPSEQVSQLLITICIPISTCVFNSKQKLHALFFLKLSELILFVCLFVVVLLCLYSICTGTLGHVALWDVFKMHFVVVS